MENASERKGFCKGIVIGISASCTTPFVLSSLQKCRQNQITIGCIVNNPTSPIAAQAEFPVETITGPEFISGSTRMKSATAQKIIFDIISNTTMIQLGRVLDNQMVHVKLINNKIINRSVRMLMNKSGLESYEGDRSILLDHGNVQNALDYLKNEQQ